MFFFSAHSFYQCLALLVGAQFIFVERRRDEKGGKELPVGVDSSCLKDYWLRLQELLQGIDLLILESEAIQ